ncbi:MAG: VOC family protein [Stellaceae bacterium]
MVERTEPLRGRLHHLQLGSPEPQRLARFYADVLGMTAEEQDGRFLCRTRGRRHYFAPGPAKTLQFAAYALEGQAALDGLAARLARHGVAHEPSPTELFEANALAVRDPDGNRLVFGLARSDQGASPRMPARLQHLVLGSPDAARMVAFYSEVLGYRVSDRVVDDGGTLRTCFLRSDDEHHSFAVFQTELSRLDHHCYETPDWNAIRDWGDLLAAKRIPVTWGPGRHGPGNNLFLFFHDPDGNWLEVSAELEVVTPDRAIGLWPHAERTLNIWGQAPLRS